MGGTPSKPASNENRAAKPVMKERKAAANDSPAIPQKQQPQKPSDNEGAKYSKGEVVGDFEIQSELGKGAFGRVYKAKRRSRANEVVALKVIFCKNDEERNKVLEEVRQQVPLDHPNIVKCFEFFLADDNVILVLQYCENGSLSSIITRIHGKGFLDENVLKKWVFQSLDALRYLHERRIIHRDMKTGNSFSAALPSKRLVFLAKKWTTARIGDFGLSRTLSDTSTYATTVAGTPFYMAPEQIQQATYDVKIDIWAMGCIVLTMCVPQHVLKARGLLSVVSLQTPDKREKAVQLIVSQGYSEELRVLVAKMLTVEAEDRPNASELLQDPYFASVAMEGALFFVGEFDNPVPSQEPETTITTEAVIAVEERPAPPTDSDMAGFMTRSFVKRELDSGSKHFGIALVNRSNMITVWNFSAQCMFGFEASEVLGTMNPIELFDPAALSNLNAALSEYYTRSIALEQTLFYMADSGSKEFERQTMQCRRKDGSRFNADVMVKRLDEKDPMENLGDNSYFVVVNPM